MNKCIFYGKIINKEFTLDDNGKERIFVYLLVENKRQGKASKRLDTEELCFEAWGSAAITLYNNADCGSYLLINDSTARTHDDLVCFRINEFKIIPSQ